ncbi:MAG TPA: type II secretion system minor pseudopilin GspI [Steroidobacteraceae bacterium]|nr:type II secretion system minor pseudopilin GspI [Steroidobacteraceae bacterium]
MTHRPSSGFTLIEVLIALLVIALGVGALLGTLTSSADTVAALRDKSIAEWLALNRISEVRLSATRPGVGVSSGTVDNYAGGRWSWQQSVSDPGMAGILRVEVKVAPMTAATAATMQTTDATRASSDFPALATAYGFLGTSVAAPTGVDPDWSLAAAATGGGTGTGGTTGTGSTSGGSTGGGGPPGGGGGGTGKP